jgi:ligand-binding sensor domain-containing protein
MNLTDFIPNKNISVKLFLAIGLFFLTMATSSESKGQSSNSIKPFGNGIVAKKFYSSTVDNKNTIWFLTESGIVSYNGKEWTLHNKNPKILASEAKQLAYISGSEGDEIWLATPTGANAVASPVDMNSVVKNLTTLNSKIVGNKVVSIAGGQMNIRWVVSENGVAAIYNNNWIKNDYAERYPEDIFQYYPISSAAATPKGDTLYVGTLGGGVMRFFKDQQVDAVSGASEFAVWGPILIPSDTVFCVHIAADGTQWMGTNKGAAKHVGNNTLEGWFAFDTKSGLADNQVQAVQTDSKGNIYFGTPKGLSVLSGKEWTTYTLGNGLVSNNILTIVIDREDNAWLGTDNGISCLKNGSIISFQ